MSDDKKVKAIAFHFREILKVLGEDVESEHLDKTPVRAAKSIIHLTSGNQVSMMYVLHNLTRPCGTLKCGNILFVSLRSSISRFKIYINRYLIYKTSWIFAVADQGLPDGIFTYQKYQFWYILEGRCWYILWQLGIFYILSFGMLFRLGKLYQEKSGNLGWCFLL
jgi:hypothetical protein